MRPGLGKMAVMTISKRIARHLENASWIRKLFEEGQQMTRDGGGPVYDFSIGNPDLEPPEKLTRALRRIVAEDVVGKHRYMPNSGYVESRQRVADALTRETGVGFGAQHIIMTVGAAGAVNTALKALVDPGDQVIVTAPYFVEYTFYIENHSAEMVITPAKGDFDLDPDGIGDKISPKTRVVLINNPNNPTGVVYRQETLRRLGEVLQGASERYGRPIYLLDDAPYRKLVYDDAPCPDVFTAYGNALMATSHSKDLGIPGERIGYLAISPRCQDWKRVADAAAFTNRTLGYVNAPALMQRVVATLQDTVIDIDWYRRKRDRLYAALTGFGYRVPRPGGAFYLFPEAPGRDDLSFIQKLKSMRVLVVPSSGFGVSGHFRIAYCVSDACIEGALPIFERALKT
jgi:aspartate aminotransferase